MHGAPRSRARLSRRDGEPVHADRAVAIDRRAAAASAHSHMPDLAGSFFDRQFELRTQRVAVASRVRAGLQGRAAVGDVGVQLDRTGVDDGPVSATGVVFDFCVRAPVHACLKQVVSVHLGNIVLQGI